MTAKICAFARAYHSNISTNKIFDDYLAFDLMGKDEYDSIKDLIGQKFSGARGSGDFDYLFTRYIAPIPLSRIRFTEDALAIFASKYGHVQYVISGAGFDTFTFRNENPGIEVFEIDHPNTQSYKLKRIAELQWNIPENVHFVPVNFEKDDISAALLNAGFDSRRKTFFSILGVSYYLTLPVFANTIKQLSGLSSAGSQVVFDYPDDSMSDPNLASEQIKVISGMTEQLGEKMQSGFTYLEIEEMLCNAGFSTDIYLSPEKIQKAYFNKNKENYTAFDNVHFISAVKGKKE